MSDDYKLTRHKVPSTPGGARSFQAPDGDYVPCRVVTTRTDHLTILWRPASEVRVEIEGQSVEGLEELSALIGQGGGDE